MLFRMSSTVRGPNVLLVHGGWHGSWAFDLVVDLLAARGITARTVDLPSSGSSAGRDADIAVVRASLAAHAAPTVVAGHSYGGAVISDACAGAPNVVGLAYLCAFVPDRGEPMLEVLPPWIEVDAPAGVCRPLTPERVFYADVEPALAARAIARLVPHSLASVLVPQTAAAWRELPSSYLLCERDQALPLSAQEALAERTGTVERVPAGHSPFLSHPAELAGFLARAAERAM